MCLIAVQKGNPNNKKWWSTAAFGNPKCRVANLYNRAYAWPLSRKTSSCSGPSRTSMGPGQWTLPRCCQLGDFSRMQESLKPTEVPVKALYKAGVADGWENPQLTLNLVPKNGSTTDLSTAPELRRAQESEGPPLRWGLPRTVCTGEFPPQLQQYVAQHSDLDALGIWPSRAQTDLHSWSFLCMQNQII